MRTAKPLRVSRSAVARPVPFRPVALSTAIAPGVTGAAGTAFAGAGTAGSGTVATGGGAVGVGGGAGAAGGAVGVPGTVGAGRGGATGAPVRRAGARSSGEASVTISATAAAAA